MTVDSEAIFAVAAHSRNDPAALEVLTGAMAAAWLDAREPDTVFAARGVGRPLWLGLADDELFFASTKAALEVVEEYVHVKLKKREIKDGTFLAFRDGRITRNVRFRPDLDYREADPLPTVRAPGEGVSCLERLAALAAA